VFALPESKNFRRLGGGVFLQPCIFQIQACYRTSTLSEFYGGLYTARNYSKHTGKFLPRESLLQKHKRISVSHRMRQRRKLQKLSTYFEKRAGKAWLIVIHHVAMQSLKDADIYQNTGNYLSGLDELNACKYNQEQTLHSGKCNDKSHGPSTTNAHHSQGFNLKWQKIFLLHFFGTPSVSPRRLLFLLCLIQSLRLPCAFVGQLSSSRPVVIALTMQGYSLKGVTKSRVEFCNKKGIFVWWCLFS